MPWQEVSKMSLKREFVTLALAEGANIRELCRRFGISPTTGYKWLARYEQSGVQGLQERSKRPHESPNQSNDKVVQAVLAIRRAHPAWGGRKIRARLAALGQQSLPSASTVTEILRRHGELSAEESEKHTAWQRFEHEAPNRLWQMDFKGDFATGSGRCYPLTVLDDHSRFSVCLTACADQRGETVKAALVEAFRLYGMPERFTMDNGAPWGSSEPPFHTAFTLWLVRLGIRVSHSRPYHPQTQGKDERFHRTLKAEVLAREAFRDLVHCQHRFDAWRGVYNHERPHEALANQVPASRYQASWRAYPEVLEPIEYSPGDAVRKVQGKGEISYQGRLIRVGVAFRGLPVALRPTNRDGIVEVYFCHQLVTEVDLRQEEKL